MSETDGAPKVPVPGVITALSVLLFVGAGVLALSALVQAIGHDLTGTLRAVEYGAFAVLYLVLGLTIRRGRRWARVVLIVLCVLGLLLAVPAILGSPQGALVRVGSSVIYLVLLGTREARDWFRPRPTADPAGPAQTA